MRAFDAWETGARAGGFPTAGPEMVIGVTDRRLVVWRTSFVLARPVEIAEGMPLERIIELSVVRHGLVTGVAFVLDNGTIVEIEAMRSRTLRRLAYEAVTAVAERRKRA